MTAHSQPCAAICGAKGVGKSTFARLLVNSLLNQHASVAFLDADCGQPELTVPGQAPAQEPKCKARSVRMPLFCVRSCTVRRSAHWRHAGTFLEVAVLLCLLLRLCGRVAVGFCNRRQLNGNTTC